MAPDLRPATEADRPFLAWLEEICMRDHAVALWGVWRPRPDHAFSLEGVRIVVEADRDAGCVAVLRRRDHLWIDRLYVAPALQHHGLGAAVLRRVASEAASEGLPVSLSVLTTNPALAFYRRNGFRVECETPERRYLSNTPGP